MWLPLPSPSTSLGSDVPTCSSRPHTRRLQMELCKKDLEFVLKAEEKELRDVKKSQGMKISLAFTTTFEKVKDMLKVRS